MSQSNEFACPTGLRQVNVCGTIGVSGSAQIDYSLEEQWTGIHWIDGRKIYQKTVACGQMIANGDKNIAHNIANLDFAVEMKGFALDGTKSRPLPYVGGAYYNNSVSIRRVDAALLVIGTMAGTGGWADVHQYYVTIQYVCTDR